MNIGSLKRKNGRLILEGLDLEEGQEAVILKGESENSFRLPPEDEARLLESIAEADRGELVDGMTLLRTL